MEKVGSMLERELKRIDIRIDKKLHSYNRHTEHYRATEKGENDLKAITALEDEQIEAQIMLDNINENIALFTNRNDPTPY